MRRMRKRIGISLAVLAAAAALPVFAAKRKTPDSYVVLYGTVFRDTGFTLPNAEVVVIPDTQEAGAARVKKMQTVSNSRGEFAFHLPTANLHYTVRVTAKGFRAEQKGITVNGEDRIDVTFQLQAESK